MVSVVIATYNRADLIMRAVNSVLEQTCREWELIIVDDGSTDGTRDRLPLGQEKLVYFYQENKGLPGARNTGIRLASGEWVSFLDSDDYWLETKLEREADLLSRLSFNVGACFSDVTFFGNPRLEDESAFSNAGLKTAPDPVVSNPRRFILQPVTPFYPSAATLRRSLLDRVAFDPSMHFGDDTDFLFRLSFEADFACLGEPLVRIDRTETGRDSIMELWAKRDVGAYRCRDRMFAKWLSCYPDMDEASRARIFELWRSTLYSWAAACLRCGNLAGTMEAVRKLKAMGDGHSAIVHEMSSRAVGSVFGRAEREKGA